MANAAKLAALATPESLWIKTLILKRAEGFLAPAINPVSALHLRGTRIAAFLKSL
jgi:hypothetical protein